MILRRFLRGWAVRAGLCKTVRGVLGFCGVVEGAADAEGAAVEDVGVDHGGGDVAVAEQLLDGADVVAGFEEVGGEGVAEGVAADALGELCGERCLADGTLNDGFVEVVTAALVGFGVVVDAGGGEEPLPRPFAGGVRVLASERLG